MTLLIYRNRIYTAVDPEKGLLDSLPVHNGDVKAPLPNLDEGCRSCYEAI
jgi:hypothetical protein